MNEVQILINKMGIEQYLKSGLRQYLINIGKGSIFNQLGEEQYQRFVEEIERTIGYEQLFEVTKYIKGVVYDIDDTIQKSSPLIQRYVNEHWSDYSQSELEFLKDDISAHRLRLEMIRSAIEKAKANNEKPDLSFLGYVHDAIIRINEKNNDEYYEFYEKPLHKAILNSERAIKNLDNYFEERDNLLEMDGRLPFDADGRLQEGYEGIDYATICSDKHTFPEANLEINLIFALLGRGKVYTLTAHNGISNDEGRELTCKKHLMKRINNNIINIGIRCHNQNDIHVRGERRQIQDKAKKFMKLHNLTSLEGYVLIDDNERHCSKWREYGGIAILVNRTNNPNLTNYNTIDSLNTLGILSILSSEMQKKKGKMLTL